MIERIIQIVAGVADLKPSALDVDTPIEALAIDSLEFVELMQLVEEEFWKVPEVRWQFICCPGDIVRELEAAK